MNIHEKYMKRCLDLAKNGLGQTYPNPMVGRVIVHKDKIIAEGWHQRAGQAHAEVNAINQIKDQSLIKHATLYVSLEPCSHYGKTPPCADLIIDKGFKKIVIGSIDPFAKVKGKGIQKLMAKGCEVVLGVLEDECLDLNKRFIMFHTHKRPYIILKWVESQDGFLSPFEFCRDQNQAPVWLTNTYSKQRVHQWRSQEQAILVGTHTALMDNPALTTRLWKGQNPLRIVIDKNLKIPKTSKIFSNEAQTLVFTSRQESDFKTTTFCQIDFKQPILPQLLNELHKRNIQSLLVEGGRVTLQEFINADLWDEARVFKSPKQLKLGTKSPIFKGQLIKSERIVEDELKFFKPIK
ncbi:bifunctional diaminohydroxyphosphoribosylaminopyrimidine deaminase/5-amino-6-(5-phosphoribosylamino)uracil reductase RibD [Flavobacterium sp. CS20]|uniref:bifunctional diaminohydroxyphosphoribosylaminopyrimidine deaminase/5-amino-6-(5-phosphoribosylamino)uracil reductase RibD n=1 Tax=Flavobacterium sp. CS20 TaxID=2775246 RepID=UPI001B3A0EFD|nr:bifunctional diaminohydroxyphosphoribosylaminopyrimidine deaminase/5-amino-6-(5-phosphoribosylamino)uracil reductase RibD [Flavobacterium sp. CS20]QTY26524.1 bifunctional diaminohydroxyphosphoribosylaminopyrimidine deaminase/5-amino-6-(5-phosphoribosylamino)uracil reductase RibD [Flavobacterium sp. CS20]